MSDFIGALAHLKNKGNYIIPSLRLLLEDGPPGRVNFANGFSAGKGDKKNEFKVYGKRPDHHKTCVAVIHVKGGLGDDTEYEDLEIKPVQVGAGRSSRKNRRTRNRTRRQR